MTNRWSDNLLFDELLAQHGFAVLHADNRGMRYAAAVTLPRPPGTTSVPFSLKIS